MAQQKSAMWCYFGHQPKGEETKIKKFCLWDGSILNPFYIQSTTLPLPRKIKARLGIHAIYLCVYIYHHSFTKKIDVILKRFKTLTLFEPILSLT